MSGAPSATTSGATPSDSSSATNTLSSSDLEATITSAPTPCPEVVFQVATTLHVKYDRYYPGVPVDTFQPEYLALADGSLISSPFQDDLFSAHLTLLILGALAAIFFRNVYVSFDYVRRGRVKKKILFHVLLASQLLGPLSLLPSIVAYFTRRVNCTLIVHFSYVAATLSLGLLITGILGTKAYKCLENPRILIVVLVLLQMGATALVILDVIMTRGSRRLTGSCVQVGPMTFTRIFVIVQFAQSLLICLCFVYACYKSRGSPASRGRMSVRVSLDDIPIQMPPADEDTNPQSRGWWDHIPANEQNNAGARAGNPGNSPGAELKSPSGLTAVPRREQRRRANTLDSQANKEHDATQFDSSLDASPIDGAPGSPAWSAGSRLSRLLPKMTLFGKVVKDELLYTTLITFTCVIVAVFALVGLHFRTPLTVTGWIALNWAIISLLTVHSFGRVVHRHERESWIQQSASRSVRFVMAQSQRNNSRRTLAPSTRTPSTFTSRSKSIIKPYVRAGDRNDPYGDAQPLDAEKMSWNFGSIEPSPPRPARSPLLFSVRNVTATNSTVTQEFEFETAERETPRQLQRNVSWKSVSANRI